MARSVETQAYAKSKVDSEHMLNAAAAASLSSPPTFTNRRGWTRAVLLFRLTRLRFL
jgi:hypothetical protein